MNINELQGYTTSCMTHLDVYLNKDKMDAGWTVPISAASCRVIDKLLVLIGREQVIILSLANILQFNKPTCVCITYKQCHRLRSMRILRVGLTIPGYLVREGATGQ